MKPGVCDEWLASNRLIHDTGLIKVRVRLYIHRGMRGEIL
jgi:hypothetical protein